MISALESGPKHWHYRVACDKCGASVDGYAVSTDADGGYVAAVFTAYKAGWRHFIADTPPQDWCPRCLSMKHEQTQ